jgi:Uma2 family endonuclease
MAVAPKRLSLNEFLKLPEAKPALEYIEGRIVQKVSPQWQHAMLQFGLAESINRFGRARKLAMAFPELRARIGGSALVPDIAVHRWDRLPFNASGRLENGPEEPPAIAIEIASPGQSIGGLIEKCLLYLEYGVELVLLIDPADEVALLFRPGRTEALRDEALVDLTSVLPGFKLTARDIFDLLNRPDNIDSD